MNSQLWIIDLCYLNYAIFNKHSDFRPGKNGKSGIPGKEGLKGSKGAPGLFGLDGSPGF